MGNDGIFTPRIHRTESLAPLLRHHDLWCEDVAPAEVEAVLPSHPGVAEAGVFARPDPEWGEAVTARVRLRDDARATPEELLAFCAARLAGYQVPKAIELTAAPLPRTASGKLLRREL